MMVKRMTYKDQLSEAGTAHRLKMKKKRKAGEKGTKWQHSGMKSKNWRRSWNKEGWKKAPGSRRSCEKVPELVVQERVSQGKGVKGLKEKKKVQGWSIDEMKENQMLLWWKTLKN